MSDDSPPPHSPLSSRHVTLVVFIYTERGATSVSLPQKGTVVIGRGPEAEVFIGSDEVSRRHAQFEVSGMDVILTDLGSRLGTYVNDRLLAGPLRVTPSDQIRVGDAVLMLERNVDSIPPRRAPSSERIRPTGRRSRPWKT